MNQLLIELNSGNSVLIEQADLPEFWEAIKKEPDLYSFRYEYFETMVKITLVERKKNGRNNQPDQTD
jgi:hypothetical protein